MERGLDNMSDSTGLCLQDLVGGGGGGGGSGGGGNGGGGGNNNGSNSDHLHNHNHNHHSLHDSVQSAVSVSSAITSLMSPGSVGSGLSHLHHGTHDLSGHHHHHHHSVGTPSLHEPLEKLKCKYRIVSYLNLIIN